MERRQYLSVFVLVRDLGLDERYGSGLCRARVRVPSVMDDLPAHRGLDCRRAQQRAGVSPELHQAKSALLVPVGEEVPQMLHAPRTSPCLEKSVNMANSSEHALYGGLAGGITYLLMCQHYDRQPDLLELLVCTGTGVLAGAVPDALEPADHPHHRQFAYSFTAGALLMRLANDQCRIENGGLDQFEKILLASGIAGYVPSRCRRVYAKGFAGNLIEERMSIRITCINKSGGYHQDPHHAISHLGWVEDGQGRQGRTPGSKYTSGSKPAVVLPMSKIGAETKRTYIRERMHTALNLCRPTRITSGQTTCCHCRSAEGGLWSTPRGLNGATLIVQLSKIRKRKICQIERPTNALAPLAVLCVLAMSPGTNQDFLLALDAGTPRSIPFLGA